MFKLYHNSYKFGHVRLYCEHIFKIFCYFLYDVPIGYKKKNNVSLRETARKKSFFSGRATKRDGVTKKNYYFLLRLPLPSIFTYYKHRMRWNFFRAVSIDLRYQCLSPEYQQGI